MKKSYILIVLALVAMVATGCKKEDVVRSFSSFRINESGFNDPDTKMHFTLASDGATGGLSKLCYDNGDKVLVNGHSFTLSNTGSVWMANADDGNPVEAPRFYTIFKNPGMGITGSGPTYDFDYSTNFTGQVANANATGVILAGSTADSLLTLNPGCCILRFPADEAMDYVYVGFSAGTVPKTGRVTIADDGTPTITATGHLGGVTSENSGEYLQMHSDGGVNTYYVAVPIKGVGVSTQLFFKWKYSASSEVYKFKTSGNVTLQKGKVYTVGKTRVSPFQTDGSSNSYFIVSPTRAVRFSAGNLQYSPDNEKWQFAPNQYEAIGYDNNQIGMFYMGWIDLFGFGCSGSTYSPVETGTTIAGFYDNTGSIAATNNDWGVYLQNNIYYGSNRTTATTWRTLTQAEWNYLMAEDGNSNRTDKWGFATINGMYKGVVLIPNGIKPDGGASSAWTSPCSFTAGGASGFSTNTYSMDEWSQMEAAGAIFLPVTGYREGTTVNNFNLEGYYWSTTGEAASDDAYPMNFVMDGPDAYADATVPTPRYTGCAVRLVRNR